MKIKSLKIENFKSFEKQELQFDKVNIIIGANATGKSNLVTAIRFINNVVQYGIEDAISLLGGINFATNINIPKGTPMKMAIVFEPDCEWSRHLSRKNDERACLTAIDYSFSIAQNLRGHNYKILQESCSFHYALIPADCDNNVEYVKKQGEENAFRYFIERERNSYQAKVLENKTKYNETQLNEFLGLKFIEKILKEDKQELILNKISLFVPPIYFRNDSMKIYDFDPKLLKLSSPIIAKKSLEENGANISIVLQQILKDKKKRDKLIKLVESCLPYVKSLEVENNIDKSVSYTITEKYNTQSLYAQFLSDGTVSILALIIALYFNKNEQVIVLEEPERNLHPQLMRKLIEMIKDVSTKTQVFITTHNPELIKYAELESIYFASRDKNGFTHLTKPIQNEKVNIFLSNELGIDELFISNLLGD